MRGGREHSGQNRVDRFAEIHFESFVAGDFEAARVQAELFEHGGVDIGDVMAVDYGVEAEFVG